MGKPRDKWAKHRKDEDWGIGDRRPPDSSAYDPPGEDMPDDQAGRYPLAKTLPAPSPIAKLVDPGLVEFARAAVEGARANSTRRGYEFHWEQFKKWCRALGVPFLPADVDTVALYLSHLARDASPRSGRRRGQRGMSIASLERTKSAIKAMHDEAELSSPTDHVRVKNLLKGLRRAATEGPSRARPLLPEHLAAIVQALRAKRKAAKFLRDRAILLVGFAGALRRNEIAALRGVDVRTTAGGLFVELSRQQGRKKSEVLPGTKYHAAGEGMSVSFERDEAMTRLGICPIEAAREWADAREWTDAGPGDPELPFARKIVDDEVTAEGMASKKVERLVKEGVALVGLDPSRYGGHSLRAGCATYLIWERKWNLFSVRDHLRHENVETLNVYVRDWDELPTREK